MEDVKMPNEDPLEWVKNDNRRFLRAIINVGDLDRSIEFYTECFGMMLLRRLDLGEKNYSFAVLGFGPEESHFVIEMRYYSGVDTYELGTAFNEFAISTQDVNGIVEKVRAKGGIITREPGPLPGAGAGIIFAFVLDPTGYSFEIIERPPTFDPLCQISFHISDIDRSIEFYQKALGMKVLLPKFDVTQDQYTLAMLGYGTDFNQTTVVEFKRDFVPREYVKGNGYQQLIIGTSDVYKSSEAIEIVSRELGGKITQPPGPIPILNTKIVAFVDPDNWAMVLVDNEDYLKQVQQKEI